MENDSTKPLSKVIRIDESEISITTRGRPFLRNICMPFDAYLGDADSKGVRFSATV